MVAAAKPARSPTTPPPRATTQSVRVRPNWAKLLHRRASCLEHLLCSPAGTTKVSTWNPARARLWATVSPYSGATWESVTRATFRAWGTTEQM